MKKIILYSLILICTATYSSAATYSVTLPELNGTYIFEGPNTSASFDFGLQFSSIESMTIEVTASGTNGSVLRTPLNGDPSQTLSLSPTAEFYFEWEEGFESRPYGGLGPFTSTVQTDSDTTSSPVSLGFLLDGEGVLDFGHMTVLFLTDATYEILTPSEFEVENVTLTVNGTPVPVPQALWLLGSGLIGLVGLRRFKN